MLLDVLIPLSRDPPGSGTAFKLGKNEIVVNPYGGAVVFKGNVRHRGAAHPAKVPRIFLYAAVTTGENWN